MFIHKDSAMSVHTCTCIFLVSHHDNEILHVHVPFNILHVHVHTVMYTLHC